MTLQAGPPASGTRDYRCDVLLVDVAFTEALLIYSCRTRQPPVVISLGTARPRSPTLKAGVPQRPPTPYLSIQSIVGDVVLKSSPISRRRRLRVAFCLFPQALLSKGLNRWKQADVSPPTDCTHIRIGCGVPFFVPPPRSRRVTHVAWHVAREARSVLSDVEFVRLKTVLAALFKHL